ncbi:MAG: efflux RND transporter periplasmic adaptor subunit [Desulfotomaculaceae bacterium]|nr:efflux RND transporter periplasmic adaptor subunit [Desulfotomaculaceae bacterium]
MKRKTKITCVVVFLAAVIGIAAWWLASSGEEVETAQVKPDSVTRVVADSGYVQPATDYNLHAAQSARIIQVPVKVGQPVTQGQTLAVLENLDLSMQIEDTRSQISQTATDASGARASLERVQLELKDARDNFSRAQELFQSGVISKVEYDKAGLVVETAEQSLNEQNSRLQTALARLEGLNRSLQQQSAKEQQLTVSSPTGGVVLAVPAKQDQTVNPGTLLVTVAALDKLEIKADILSDDLADVKTGQQVLITAPVLGANALRGEVKEIYPRAEEKTSALGVVQRRVPVIISLNGPANLKPGYEVRVAIETISRQNVLTLPREAVRTTGDGQKEVMVIIDSRVRHKPVKTGISDQEKIEITGGLEAGDLVIKDAGLDLKEKTKVRFKKYL